jgi:protein-S-isoprenylcysteine O-methyltransferase Ste14
MAAILGYSLMAAFFGLEILGRRPNRARSFKAGPATRGTAVLLGFANTTSTLLSPLLNFLRIGRVSRRARTAPFGIGLMVLGLSLRLWAMLTLGPFYTRTLRVSKGQHVLERGPYRWIRHPGYLGTLLTWVGLPLALSNWLSAILVAAMIAAAYRIRIPAEEEMLIESFGDRYRRYMLKTNRFLPFIL